jgi:hypothetical protein
MNIDTYIEKLRDSLRAAAELGGDEARQAADRVGVALTPAARLAIMEAVTQAAAEISSELPSGSVGVRLEGEGLRFDFQHGAESYPQPPAAPADDEDDSLTARITLRIPESVKTRVEECAGNAGVSLNSWITTVLREASQDSGWSARINLGGVPVVDVQAPWAEWAKPGKRSGTRLQGWI